MELNQNEDKVIENVKMTFQEIKESCDYISKLCKENLDILGNPYRFVMETDNFLKNAQKINIKFAALANFIEVISNQDRKGD